MLENFVETIQGRTKLSANGSDGLRALEVVEAAYNRSQRGKSYRSDLSSFRSRCQTCKDLSLELLNGYSALK
jgi:hypothetical protein